MALRLNQHSNPEAVRQNVWAVSNRVALRIMFCLNQSFLNKPINLVKELLCKQGFYGDGMTRKKPMNSCFNEGLKHFGLDAVKPPILSLDNWIG